MDRAIVHMDLDTFFVSVERLVNPGLLGKPVLIGGSSDRGVVASCSYEARRFGVHSAMPMKLARQLCPDAILVRGDMEQYSRYSQLVTQVIADSVPLYEKTSIDEFYLDLSGMDRFFGTYQFSSELRQRITRESGLPISFGLSANKTVSKVATGEAKPAGQLKIDFGAERPFLAPLSVKKIPGIGDKAYRTLRGLGVEHIRTLQQMPPELLQKVFGKHGVAMWKKANGEDETPVIPYTEEKSISTEETFDTDTIDTAFLRSTLISMTEKLAHKLRSKQKLTACITVKLRYSNFETFTRQLRIPYTSADHILIPKVKELFDKLYERRMLVRLVGVRFSHLVHGNYQIDLFDDSEEHMRLYQAMDRMKKRFGTAAVRRAVALGTRHKEFNPFNGVRV
ncbi:MAG: DNA polymerase IV [Bacteroidota bacterium]|nr:DNA polymerase IV [Bacteroidota bacterium]MDX5404306.1 DNA polymerase IV [Bacteroidota bacterium]MDX5426941.1 DNA polymerase IV [Bacteroidota bacterium]MDX5447318.1 DNA polymerase IV [Bacteroidota bacterium]MDX5504929.1 DNA polymerase IV [Bacteroidota bacterium]